MDQVDPKGYERLVHGDSWRWFQAMLRLPDGSEVPGIFLRCPICAAVVDWRDQRYHLIWHGVTNITTIQRIESQQMAEWAGQIVL